MSLADLVRKPKSEPEPPESIEDLLWAVPLPPDDARSRWFRCQKHRVKWAKDYISSLDMWHGCCPECNVEDNLRSKAAEVLRSREADRLARISAKLEEQEQSLQADVDAEYRRLAADIRADIENNLRGQLETQVRNDVDAEMSAEILAELIAQHKAEQKGTHGN